MAGERRRCCLKIAEEEILPVSLEVQERLLLLLQGSWADAPPESLLGMPCEQSFFSHVLIIPSSSSTPMAPWALPFLLTLISERPFLVGHGLTKEGNMFA